VRRPAVEREREVAERIVRGPVVQRARAQRLQLVAVPRPQGHLAHVRAPQGLRRIAARYDKLATNFLAAIQLAAAHRFPGCESGA
jgi:hypothetical protein